MEDNKSNKSELQNILDESILVFYSKKNKKDIEKTFCKFIHLNNNEKPKLTNEEISATIIEAANKKLNNSTVNKIKKIKKHKIRYYEVEYE
jgi:hypothetical protein